ncbi:MAG: TetR/AcrR family transcriptional regulator [Bacteroidota bacterium]
MEKRKAGRPREKQSLDTDYILQVALKQFANEGFGGVSLHAIAKETNVAVSLLSYHFGNKEELWKKSMSLVGQEIYGELKILFQMIDDMDGLEKLRIFNKKIVHFSAKRPEFQQCIVQEVFSNNARSNWVIEELLRPIFSFMEGIIKQEQAKGTIKKVPQANLSSFIIGSITTLFSRSYQMQKVYNIDPYDQAQIDQHVTVINDLIFNGLKTGEKD